VSDLLRIVVVLGLVALNAFFVIGEYAVVTARRAALGARAEAGGRGAQAALRLMDDPVRVISTVQVGITAVGILIGAIGEPLVNDLLGGGLPSWLGFALAFAIVTYLSVVLGELVPKALTLQRAEALATLVAPAIELIATVLRPVVWVLQASATVLLRPFGIRDVVVGDAIGSPDELRALIDEAESSGVIPLAQEELLFNVFDFPSREVRDVMVPALDVAWLDGGLAPGAAVARALEAPHTRYPVGDGELDRVIGIVLFSDLVAAERRGEPATVAELARPALVVPATKDLGALLREQREQRRQLAVVIDEYGGTAGVVSVEDVLEELVGEIQGEFELPDDTLTWVGEHAVRVAGSMTIDDFNEAVGTTLPQDGPRTMAGLTFDALGRRPGPGDVVELDGVRLKVDAVDGLRITRLEVMLPR
jgi:putative hemolysin